MADFCYICGIQINLLAMVCSILALSLDYWENGTISQEGVGPILVKYVQMWAGLWHEYHTLHNIPTGVSSTTKLWRDINFETKEEVMLLTVRLLLFIAVFALVAATICIILRLKVNQKMKHQLMNTAWSLSLEAGFLLLICFVVYLARIKEKTTDLLVAFYLNILAWLLAWFAGILFFKSSRTIVATAAEDMASPAELL